MNAFSLEKQDYTVEKIEMKLKGIDIQPIKNKLPNTMKCQYCDFETISVPGLRIHLKKAHINYY